MPAPGHASHLLSSLTYPTCLSGSQTLVEKTKTVDELHELTAIDHWFLRRLERIANFRDVLVGHGSLERVPTADLVTAKRLGYSDRQIAAMLKTTDDAVRARRKADNIVPVVKQIDTLAAEYPAQTNYLYCTYNGDEDDVLKGEGGVVVLGSGTYRIGSSVEFDWCGVSAIRALRGEFGVELWCQIGRSSCGVRDSRDDHGHRGEKHSGGREDDVLSCVYGCR